MFTIPIFGGIPVKESVVVTWIIMAVIVGLCIIFVRSLSVENPGKVQLLLESAIGKGLDFFEDIMGKENRKYIPYLITVLIYIGIANIIGLFGFKSPTKDLNVTAGVNMANIREIQTRINSVKDTMKITNAMYMISSTKMRQAKKKLTDSEPYFYGLQGEISRILRHIPEIEHRYFDVREEIPKEKRKIGSIVITADKGLAGAYNHNIVKVEDEILEEPGEHKLFVVGELGRHYYANKGVEIDTNFLYTVQKPTMHRARDIAEVILSQYERGELDEVYIVYTRMENSMLTTVEKMKILPLERSSFNEMKMPLNIHREAIALYPSAEAVLDSIVPNYVVGMIYGCLVEAYASEHNARMTAMQSATDSAQEIIKDLSIIYNRARQAAITQEITEVCAGAKAQKRKRK